MNERPACLAPCPSHPKSNWRPLPDRADSPVASSSRPRAVTVPLPTTAVTLPTSHLSSHGRPLAAASADGSDLTLNFAPRPSVAPSCPAAEGLSPRTSTRAAVPDSHPLVHGASGLHTAVSRPTTCQSQDVAARGRYLLKVKACASPRQAGLPGPGGARGSSSGSGWAVRLVSCLDKCWVLSRPRPGLAGGQDRLAARG